MDRTELIHTLNQQVRYINKQLNEQLKKHKLYHSQWLIIYCLQRFGPMTQTEIWQYLNVEAPTVTRTLKRMEENGWIIRKQGEDKRERLILLSNSAKEKYDAIKQSVEQFEVNILKAFTEEEQVQLATLIKKIGE